MQTAVFLDRDGVLTRPTVRENKAYAPLSLQDFKIYETAPAEVARLKSSGLAIVVVTNQPEVSRGNLPPSTLAAMHEQLARTIPVDGIYVCPHEDSDHCSCRKPASGLLTRAAGELGIDLTVSYMIGDTWRDIGAGGNAGCSTVLIERPYSGPSNPDWRVSRLSDAAEIVLSHSKRNGGISRRDQQRRQ